MVEQEINYEELVNNEQVDLESNWMSRLERGKGGVLLTTVNNYILFINNHPDFKDKLKYNEYLRQKEYDGGEYSDFTEEEINGAIASRFGSVNKSYANTAVSMIFNRNRYNPVVDYIKSLEWDGTERIDRLFIDLLDADDTKLNKEMTRKWMIAAIKRTLEPGSKFDNMIVLQGGQGIGKTTICEKLATGFFSTISLDEVGNKDLVDKLNKTWIAIIDELDTFNKKEMSTIKTFLSLCEDSVRLAYARNTSNFKRHCVFIGSTNDETFLRDITSSVERRFWIIKCNKTTKDGKVFNTMTPDFVSQLWAEAYHYYKENPNQYLDISAESMDDFAREQEKSKTFNDDNYIDSLKYELEREYCIKENGEVTSIDDLTCEGAGPKYKINKIPLVILKKYMRDKYKEDRSNKYIASSFSDWEYKNARYKGFDQVMKSLVRKNPVVTKKKYDPMEEFTKGLYM